LGHDEAFNVQLLAYAAYHFSGCSSQEIILVSARIDWFDTHTTVLRLSGFCPGQPGWAGTGRNIHSLTPIVVINHPLSASSVYYDTWHPLCSISVPDNLSPIFFGLPQPGTLNFILHKFLHIIIVFFSQYMPISSQPVLL